MKIIERIAQIISNNTLSVRAFEIKIGASNGMIGRAISKKTDISAEWLSKIIEILPETSAEWLLTGNGEMIKEKLSPELSPKLSPNNKISENRCASIDKSEPTIIYKRDPRDVEIIELLRSKVELLEDKVAARDEKIAALKGGDEYLEYGVVDIGTSDPAAAVPMPIMPRRNGDNVTH